VHGVLEDIVAYHYWKKQSDLPTAAYQPLFEVYQSPVYFGFNRRTLSQQQLLQLADAWQRLYASGELDKIVQRYQVQDYQFALPMPAPILPSQQ